MEGHETQLKKSLKSPHHKIFEFHLPLNIKEKDEFSLAAIT